MADKASSFHNRCDVLTGMNSRGGHCGEITTDWAGNRRNDAADSHDECHQDSEEPHGSLLCSSFCGGCVFHGFLLFPGPEVPYFVIV